MLVTVAVTMVVIMALATAALMLFIMGMTLAATAFVTIIVAVTATALVVIIVIVAMTATAATTSMNVTMGDLFGRGGTHITHGHGKVQVNPGQRMVGIYLDEIFRHFHHSHRTVAIIGIGHEGIPFGHFHTIKQLARYLLHQIFIVFAIGIGRAHIQLEAVTNGTIVQGLLQTRNQKTGAVQIDQRLTPFGAVQHIASLVGNGVIESYNTQVAHIHGRSPQLMSQDRNAQRRARKKLEISIPEKNRAEHPRQRGQDHPFSLSLTPSLPAAAKIGAHCPKTGHSQDRRLQMRI